MADGLGPGEAVGDGHYFPLEERRYRHSHPDLDPSPGPGEQETKTRMPVQANPEAWAGNCHARLIRNLNPRTRTLDPEPWTLNPEPSTLNPEP